MMATHPPERRIREWIETQLPGVVLEHHDFRGDQTIRVEPGRLLDVIDLVYMEGFQLLVDITAVDLLERVPRFDVVYHLLNLTSQERLRIKVPAGEGTAVPSLTGRFKCADWTEREVFDLFGIPFDGHPDLKRLLLWTDFPGHPLRKDFPLDGGDAFCGADTGTPYAANARPVND